MSILLATKKKKEKKGPCPSDKVNCAPVQFLAPIRSRTGSPAQEIILASPQEIRQDIPPWDVLGLITTQVSKALIGLHHQYVHTGIFKKYFE